MVKLFPYLPVVKQAILGAQPRPSIIDYDQASLAISSAVYQALTFQKSPQQALAELSASSRRSSATAYGPRQSQPLSFGINPITHCSEVVSHEY